MNIHFVTPNNDFNGYGMAEKHLKKYFAEVGINLDKKYNGQQISLVLNLASSLEGARGKTKILYTMIEGDTYPPEWVDTCRQADHIVVPNTWCQKVLKKADLDSTVINLGYDPEVFKPIKREMRNKYTFLHYEAFQGRKGWDELLDSWMASLSDKEDTQLILKTIKPYDEIPDRIKEFQNVKVISGELPHKAMACLLAEVDCFIFPSRGEGFSLPPLEAMATGLPVILTKGHSHMEYYDERYMYGVEVSKKIPAKYPWFDYPIGNWVRCNLDNLSDRIEYVYENKEEAFDKGQKAQNYVKRFSAKKTAEAFKEFLKELDN